MSETNRSVKKKKTKNKKNKKKTVKNKQKKVVRLVSHSDILSSDSGRALSNISSGLSSTFPHFTLKLVMINILILEGDLGLL